jgi:glycosyltransferase involved in cell wall biosynthesis
MRAGVEIEVMCPSSAPFFRYLKESGIKVIDFSPKSRIDLGAVRKIRGRMRQRQIDILHAFNNRAVSNSILASTGLAVKFVAYRGITGNDSFLNPGSWLTYLHPKVDRVVCVADAVRLHFLQMRFLRLRLNPRKYVTIYKGHNLKWYAASPVSLSQFGIPKDAFVVGCIANFRPRKGIHVLIDAMRYLTQAPSIHLLLVGHMDSSRLKAQIRQSPLKDRIHFTGFRADAPALIASCHANVLPSLRREGLPKGVIEAMAHGVPSIVTDSGGSPELIIDKESGMIVPSGNAEAIARAVTYLYENPRLREEMGINARERIRTHFRIEDTITKTFDVYKALLNEK